MHTCFSQCTWGQTSYGVFNCCIMTIWERGGTKHFHYYKRGLKSLLRPNRNTIFANETEFEKFESMGPFSRFSASQIQIKTFFIFSTTVTTVKAR